MAYPSPLRKLQEQAEAAFLQYGNDPRPDEGAHPVELAATYGEIEAEYASMRKAVGLLDLCHRATIEVTGTERHDFLNRMVTNQISADTPGRATRAFWLNRQGRIQADLMVLDVPDRLLLDVDIHQVESAVRTLNEFLFAEDCHIADVTQSLCHLGLCGPGAAALLDETMPSSSDSKDASPAAADMKPGQIALRQSPGRAQPIILERRDTVGDVGFRLLVHPQDVMQIHETIVEAGLNAGLRTVGWLAYNIARIEGGTPLFNVDFGPDTLPHETGILDQAVSFTKGCYLGQEVVARIQSQGKPKRVLRGLKLEGQHMPITGSYVWNVDDPNADPIGIVTSSTPSPMLGDTVIAYAMLKTSGGDAIDSTVYVQAEGQVSKARVSPLTFWPRPEA
ncbi:MAG: aminomethyl transferase family protein [Planctomycetes bacterium]|nr:aminomethyl transferase family protein [Planctomycetota bacterium]